MSAIISISSDEEDKSDDKRTKTRKRKSETVDFFVRQKKKKGKKPKLALDENSEKVIVIEDELDDTGQDAKTDMDEFADSTNGEYNENDPQYQTDYSEAGSPKENGVGEKSEDDLVVLLDEDTPTDDVNDLGSRNINSSDLNENDSVVKEDIDKNRGSNEIVNAGVKEQLPVTSNKRITPFAVSTKMSIVLIDDDDEVIEKSPNFNEASTSHMNGNEKDNICLNENNDEAESYQNICKLTRDNLDVLIEHCKKLLKNRDMQNKFAKSVEVARKCLNKIISEKKHLDGISENILGKNELLETEPTKAIVFYNEVFTELKALNSMEQVSDKRLNKLWAALYKCKEKIKRLEETEVDWDNEDDSIYIQEGKYKDRAAKIYQYICKMTKQNHNSINPLYHKLDFDKSTYADINKALSKKFKDNTNFPDLPQVLKCIRKCVEKNSLKLSDREVEYEARRCFSELGKMLKERRQRDFKINLFANIPENSDPADNNSELKEKLDSVPVKLEEKVDEVLEIYSKMEATGATMEVSDDSNDSNFTDSESS